MINIDELNTLSKILNIHELCRKSHLNYKTISARLRRHRKNAKRGKVSEQESNQLKEGLKLYKLEFDK